MSVTEGEIVPQTDRRKELLAEQFSEVESTPEAEPIKESGERARDESGKFVAKDKVEGKAAPEEGSAEIIQQPAWAKPPKSWKKEYHDYWEKADPKLREYAWQREEEMSQGVTSLKEKGIFADKINKVAEPYMATIRGLGVELPTAVEALMKADHTLRYSPPDQKRAYFMQLAQQYGVQLGDIPIEQSQVDPNAHALFNQMNMLRGEVMTLKQMQEQEKQNMLLAEIDRFAASHEHYDIARPFMIDLLNKEEAATLEEAYEKATGPGTKLHELIESSRQAAKVGNPMVNADKAAKAARAAAVSVKGSSPGAPAPTKAQDRRSMLEEQFSGLSERL